MPNGLYSLETIFVSWLPGDTPAISTLAFTTVSLTGEGPSLIPPASLRQVAGHSNSSKKWHLLEMPPSSGTWPCLPSVQLPTILMPQGLCQTLNEDSDK